MLKWAEYVKKIRTQVR